MPLPPAPTYHQGHRPGDIQQALFKNNNIPKALINCCCYACLKSHDLCPVGCCTLTTNSYSVQAIATHGLSSIFPISGVSSMAMPGEAGAHRAMEASPRQAPAVGGQWRAAGPGAGECKRFSAARGSTVWHRHLEKSWNAGMEIQCCHFA